MEELEKALELNDKTMAELLKLTTKDMEVLEKLISVFNKLSTTQAELLNILGQVEYNQDMKEIKNEK